MIDATLVNETQLVRQNVEQYFRIGTGIDVTMCFNIKEATQLVIIGQITILHASIKRSQKTEQNELFEATFSKRTKIISLFCHIHGQERFHMDYSRRMVETRR